ncbi:MAG: hypothetical protein AAGE96_03330 [Cyanobacteria bacterium P01_G01_bin.19]
MDRLVEFSRNNFSCLPQQTHAFSLSCLEMTWEDFEQLSLESDRDLSAISTKN